MFSSLKILSLKLTSVSSEGVLNAFSYFVVVCSLVEVGHLPTRPGHADLTLNPLRSRKDTLCGLEQRSLELFVRLFHALLVESQPRVLAVVLFRRFHELPMP